MEIYGDLVNFALHLTEGDRATSEDIARRTLERVGRSVQPSDRGRLFQAAAATWAEIKQQNRRQQRRPHTPLHPTPPRPARGASKSGAQESGSV